MKILHDGTEVADDVPTRVEDGRRYRLTQAEIDARAAEVAAEAASPVPGQQLDPRDFWHLFTESERLGILDSTAPAVRLLHTDLQTARYVEQGHPDTEAGLDVLVAETLLTPARAARVRAFLPPEQ